MENNSWRVAAPAASSVENDDWRAQLQADSRRRIVNKIMDTLKRHLPFSDQEGSQKLNKIVVRFKEKIYIAASSQSDYLWKISLKMLTMENNSSKAAAPAASSEGNGDWRAQLQDDSRQRIVNKIMDTLKRHLPFSGQEGLQELNKIAARFEEKIYIAATSQLDYLRKISLKMLTMENKSQNTIPNPANGSKPLDPGATGTMRQWQNVPEQQKQLYQNQRTMQDTTTTSLAHTGHGNGGDWEEETCQKDFKILALPLHL